MRLFGGVQQIGIGVEDAERAWDWYRRKLGFDIPLIDSTGIAASMLSYTGNEPRKRRAILALNLQGGGGLEIWQYLGRKPLSPPFEPLLGDLGIFAAKLRSSDLGAAHDSLQDEANEPVRDPRGTGHFFARDPFGNSFQIVSMPGGYARTGNSVGGVLGASIGVSDLDAASRFLRVVFGYDTELYRGEGLFEDLKGLPGGEGRFRRALLSRSVPSAGPFSELLGPSEIELFQVLDRSPRRLFEGRFWGDLGFIHLCFDIRGLAGFKVECASAGHPFTVDSNPGADAGLAESFDMGEASGRFAYLEDPDGSLFEVVETHRVPLIAKLGWYLDLRKRDPERALPRWMLRLLGLGRARRPRAR
jgi:catechol 2,3-dioxygenase-like lactoylglutathione lyase family enzyme